MLITQLQLTDSNQPNSYLNWNLTMTMNEVPTDFYCILLYYNSNEDYVRNNDKLTTTKSLGYQQIQTPP